MIKKNLTNLKFLFIVFFMIGGLYSAFGLLEATIGLGCGVVVITMLDKDYSQMMFSESIRIIGIQLIIGIFAFIANLNYLMLIIFTFTIGFVLHYSFNHFKKLPRTTGFLLNYMLLVYFKPTKSDMPKLLLALFVSGIFIMILYYLFSKETYFNKNYKNPIDNININEKKEFHDFKTRYSVLNGILFAIVIFVMQYFKAYHGIWLPITVIILLIPDKDLTVQKIFDRLLGTAVGCVLFMIVFKLITIPIILYILFAIAIYFMLFPMAYYKRAIAITYFALFINHLIYKNQTPLTLDMYRTLFTLLGAISVFLLFIIEEKTRKAKRVI